MIDGVVKLVTTLRPNLVFFLLELPPPPATGACARAPRGRAPRAHAPPCPQHGGFRYRGYCGRLYCGRLYCGRVYCGEAPCPRRRRPASIHRRGGRARSGCAARTARGVAPDPVIAVIAVVAAGCCGIGRDLRDCAGQGIGRGDGS